MSARGRPVLVVGDVMLDVVVRPTTAPAHGSDTTAATVAAPGGSAANTAAWLAQEGARVRLSGRVGDDMAGRLVTDALIAHGVEADLIVDHSRPTGVVVSLVDPAGERTMLTDRGANDVLRTDDLEAPRAGEHVHLAGYTLLHAGSRRAGLALLARAREAGSSTSLTAGTWAPLEALGPQRFLRWATGADLLFANLDEAVRLGARRVREPPAPERARTAARRLARTVGEAVVTAGPHGVVHARRDPGGRVSALRRPAPATDVVDTTGAGDALAAGFLVRWLVGAPPGECLDAGLRAAARAVAGVGGFPWHR